MYKALCVCEQRCGFGVLVMQVGSIVHIQGPVGRGTRRKRKVWCARRGIGEGPGEFRPERGSQEGI